MIIIIVIMIIRLVIMIIVSQRITKKNTDKMEMKGVPRQLIDGIGLSPLL